MKRAALLPLFLAVNVGCALPPGGEPREVETPPGDCAYPTAVEPMTEGETLFPYAWSRAFRADGTEVGLDLGAAPCGESDEIDWSPFDTLAFVSIPAW